IFAAALLPLATSYYVCEGMGWESGVDKSFKEAPNFFSIFLTLVIVSSFLVLMPSINLLNIMIWSQVINGIFIPLVLMFIMRLCSDPDIMGEYTNSSFYNFWGYALILLMFVANMAMIYFEFVP
ncbi:MAG: Mn transporter, partial [Bdellovibrio sp. CG_4_9_14_3_um_filter_39_7]